MDEKNKLNEKELDEVLKQIQKQFGKEVNCCTISVPHGFNNDQRNAIITAANDAGISDVYIINDPLAIGIYYISKNKLLNSENFLVIDFGSSKLDITLLNISKHNSIRVKVAGGNSECGGGIFDSEFRISIIDSFISFCDAI